MQTKLALKLRGRHINEDDDGFISVTNIWEAGKSPKDRTPNVFVSTKQWNAIAHAMYEKLFGKTLGFKISTVWKMKPGQDGGIYAHPVLALAYAEFLNPKLAIEVREVFLRAKSGDATLADEILEKASPEGNEWAARRAIGRVVRNQFTHELDKRGVSEGWQFGNVTNETYKGLFDQTAKQLKTSRGLSATENLRDKMSIKDIVFVAASEALSIERMEDEEAKGYNECRMATSKAARALRGAIEADRMDRQKQLPS